MVNTAYANLTATDGTTPTTALGSTLEIDGATWVYVKASAAVAKGKVSRITSDNTIAASTAADFTTTRPADVCIPQFDFGSGEYGWAPVGPFKLREDGVTTFVVISKTAAASVVLYGTTTAGSVDDAGTNPPIQGLTLTAAAASDDVLTACIATKRLTVNS